MFLLPLVSRPISQALLFLLACVVGFSLILTMALLMLLMVGSRADRSQSHAATSATGRESRWMGYAKAGISRPSLNPRDDSPE